MGPLFGIFSNGTFRADIFSDETFKAGIFSDGAFNVVLTSPPVFTENDEGAGFAGGTLQLEQYQGSAGYIDAQ